MIAGDRCGNDNMFGLFCRGIFEYFDCGKDSVDYAADIDSKSIADVFGDFPSGGNTGISKDKM